MSYDLTIYLGDVDATAMKAPENFSGEFYAGIFDYQEELAACEPIPKKRLFRKGKKPTVWYVIDEKRDALLKGFCSQIGLCCHSDDICIAAEFAASMIDEHSGLCYDPQTGEAYEQGDGSRLIGDVLAQFEP